LLIFDHALLVRELALIASVCVHLPKLPAAGGETVWGNHLVPALNMAIAETASSNASPATAD
jgi:hypothetical protein